MKILFVNMDGLQKLENQYYTEDPWILFPIKLAEHCEKITLLSTVEIISEKTDLSSFDGWHLENIKNIKIEYFDFYDSFITYYKLWWKRARAWKKQIKELIKNHDVVIIRLPSPMASIVTNCIQRTGKPLICIVRGNISTASDRILESHGLMRLFYSGLKSLILGQEHKCATVSRLVYVYSNELSNRFRKSNSNVKIMRTPHVSLGDFFHRTDTCQSEEVKLLRVCRLIPSKGLEHLLECLALLHSQNITAKLEIIGKERYPIYLSKLKKLTEKLEIQDHVKFTGWVPYNRTKEVFLRNDIQVISSISEGMPRCIIEGAARGLPLVSTNAGGCADILSHEKNALVVPSGNPVSMAKAIVRVIKNPELRRELIKNGYELARSSSFEVLGKQFLDEIREVVPQIRTEC